MRKPILGNSAVRARPRSEIAPAFEVPRSGFIPDGHVLPAGFGAPARLPDACVTLASFRGRSEAQPSLARHPHSRCWTENRTIAIELSLGRGTDRASRRDHGRACPPQREWNCHVGNPPVLAAKRRPCVYDICACDICRCQSGYIRFPSRREPRRFLSS
jgi:hypothetical protein